MKLRGTGILVSALAILAFSAASAMALTIIGTDGPDTITGSNQADQIDAKAGDDQIRALQGDDSVVAGDGTTGPIWARARIRPTAASAMTR